MDQRNFYSLLGCAPSSSTEQINVEFRRLAIQHHPDKCPDDPEAASRFARLQEARDVLTNDIQRALYDDWLSCGLEMTFKEYRAMRERGGWHWREERRPAQLESGVDRTNASKTTSGSGSRPPQPAAAQAPRRPHFQGSSSRSDMIRRFRNRELNP